MNAAPPAYAQVLVFWPTRIQHTPLFDYLIPDALAAVIQTGMLVVVPVRERLLPGVVLGLSDAPSVPETRPIHSVLDPEPVLTPAGLALAQWMARATLAPLHKCVQGMLPPGLRPQVVLRFTPLVLTLPEGLPDYAANLLRLLLEKGALTHTQVAQTLPDWRRARFYLQKRGYLKAERTLRVPRVSAPTTQTARLGLPRAQWDAAFSGLRRTDLYRDILTLLEKEERPLALEALYAQTGAQRAHLKVLERRGLLLLGQELLWRDPLAGTVFTPDTPPVLIPGQRVVWEAVSAHLAPDQAPRAPVLLLGVTGSGKTEIYMRATALVLERKQQALILVPEISLTPQTVRRFALRFPGQVGLWHSGMSDGERLATWQRARSGETPIVVGARSALFLPFPDLGLIVLDEEEDVSYKQGRQPHYHARDAAEELARQTNALLILGSATPSLEAYARARGGRYHLLEMPQRVLGHRRRLSDWQQQLGLETNRYRLLEEEACTIQLPPVQVVDMRTELMSGNRTIFSTALVRAVDQALARREQVILFLNRRGSATHVFCRQCAWVALCPRCDVPLVYHAGAGALLCHHCAHQSAMPRTCPQCRGTSVRAFGLGTEGLEARASEQWPKARLLRWDRDVAKSHAAHAAVLGRFAQGDADLLIGTQMIARGLDLPKVTVVGIVSADVALNLPDFRAAERTFQVLTQVAGRAGRGMLGGRVILQTYHPEHYAIQYAAVHDYLGFAQRELNFRYATGYPPGVRLAQLLYSHRRRERAELAAQALAAELRARLLAAGLPATDLIGPAPAFFARLRGRYRWQILLRSVDPAAFLRDLTLPPGWSVDIDPLSVL